MNNIQNPYTQQSKQPSQNGHGMPPPPPMFPRGRWQRKVMNMIGRAKCVYPDWLSKYAVTTYLLALIIVNVLYSTYNVPWYYLLSGIVSVFVLFIYGRRLAINTSTLQVRKERTFERRIFVIAFFVRILWTLLIYYLFMRDYGDAFGFENGDAVYYDDLGQFVSGLINDGDFHFYDAITKWNGGHGDIADMGYGIYVGFIYWLTGNSIIVVRLIKCLLSAWTVLLIYRLARRNFGEQIARVTAIFCTLWPNFWYYCGVHLKEVEMVFLTVLFVEQADQMLRSRQFTTWKIVPILLIAAIIFTFRTPLGLVAVLALLFAVIMSSTKVVSWGKRIMVGVLAIFLIGLTIGNRIQERAIGLIEKAQSNEQIDNMKWRAERKGGNTFAKYAGTAVFAPLIFTLPFPTMVRPYEGQELQQLLNGGNFFKNITSFFVIICLLTLLLSGNWRNHLLPLSFMLGYLVVLAMSNFAQSERFHQPAMPFEFMFAAYGLSIAMTKKKYKRWFTYWCGLMFMAAIAWNWFKLAGRGLV